MKKRQIDNRERDNRQKNSREFVQFVAKERNMSKVKSLKVEGKCRRVHTKNLQLTTYNQQPTT